MAYNRQVLSVLVILLFGASTSAQEQVQSGKIISPSVGPQLNRLERHAMDKIQYIDLSHPLSNETVHWPDNEGFIHKMTIDEDRNDTRSNPYHVRSDNINTATHSGTHLDAPSHFGNNSWSVDKIPLERLIDVPVTVVDLSAKVKANRSYSFLVSDFQRDGNPLVQPESVVLVYTGVSKDLDQGKGLSNYLGTSEVKDITKMKSPGFSLEAAQYLVKQRVYGVGLDAISADSSERQQTRKTYDPVAHVEFNSNNVYILENVHNNLEKLIGQNSARLTIAPLPVVNGTGSPIRLVATLGHGDCHDNVSNGVAEQEHSTAYISLIAVSTLILAIFV